MVSALQGIVELLLVFGAFAVAGAIACGPQLLAGWAGDRQDRFIREAAQQAEIARKVAIAEAAIEARKRGEKFVPPADYDR